MRENNIGAGEETRKKVIFNLFRAGAESPKQCPQVRLFIVDVGRKSCFYARFVLNWLAEKQTNNFFSRPMNGAKREPSSALWWNLVRTRSPFPCRAIKSHWFREVLRSNCIKLVGRKDAKLVETFNGSKNLSREDGATSTVTSWPKIS